MHSSFAKLTCIAFLSCAAIEAHANVITTTFASGNDFTGNFFNVTTAANGLQVTGMTVNVDRGPVVIDVYEKSGTYVGFDTNPGAWTRVSQTAVTGQGAGTPTTVAVTPFIFAANAVTGVYVTIDSNVNAAPFMYYTDGSNTYSNADLTITTGEGSGGMFGSLGIFSPRTWNGSFTYSLLQPQATVPEPESIALLGIGLLAVVGARRRRAG